MNSQETRLKVFTRAKFKCEVCGKYLTEPNSIPQLAHVLPQRKMYLNKYGKEIVHHPLNLKAVCSLNCNSKCDLGCKQGLIDEHVKIIQETLDKETI